jgi:predicted alpha-1,2-mannosidase
MNDFCSYVDVFYGSGKVDLPQPYGIAKSWHFLKAISGNTHPAAVLPFGKLSLGCYSGGYPTGYGNHLVNTNPHNLRTFNTKAKCHGFSHLHQSGTGTIGVYYNYAVTKPFYGELFEAAHPSEMLYEKAEPGYYSTKLKEIDILCEMTVSKYAAVHRYTLTEENGGISIDLSNNGFRNNDPTNRGYSKHSNIKLCGKNAFEATVVMEGIKLYIYGKCEQAENIVLWRDYLPIRNQTELSLDCVYDDFGIYFITPTAGAKEVRLSISTKSMEKAKNDVLAETRSFDEIRLDARRIWNNYLGKIEVDAPTERDKRIFYSNFYHTLVKPSDWSGESFLYDDEDAFIIDFATLWDIYKTQLPLIFTLYPEISNKIITTFIRFCEVVGHMPHRFTLSDRYGHIDQQARMIAEHSTYDAYVRGVAADYKRAVEAAEKDLFSPQMDEFHSGKCFRATHVLDIAEGCGIMAKLAREIGCEAATFDKYSGKWKSVFNQETGLLIKDSDYYEGNEWSFSFRPMLDMESRISIAGGKEKFAAMLDRFFGFTDPEDTSARFQGFNNESDMEAPAAYYYAGRYDRMCDVINAGLDYMYAEGRGGLPGNNDSGGLSSCYMWHAIGLFPITGQDKILIGSPRMNYTKIQLASGMTFEISKKGKGQYVKTAYLNDRKIEDMSFSASEMMKGGKLLLVMSENQ